MSELRPRTRGINHVNLVVSDLARSVAFYRSALGFEDAGAGPGVTFLRTPGASDLLGLQPAGGDLDRLAGKERTPGDSGGVDHIGFAVDGPTMLDAIVRAVTAHGGTLLWRTDDAEAPSAFVTDPDGYVLQLGG